MYSTGKFNNLQINGLKRVVQVYGKPSTILLSIREHIKFSFIVGMSSGSVAGAGVKESGSPGEGVNCGVCRRTDKDCTNGRMVQCDECDEWFHYDCVNVNDSIRNSDWSCNECVRTSLDKQRRAISEQMQQLNQQQKQWQHQQQKHLEQTEKQLENPEQRHEQQRQQRSQEQLDQLQTGQLQLQQPCNQLEAVTFGFNVPRQSFGSALRQNQPQPVRLADVVVSEGQEANGQSHSNPLGSFTANNVRLFSRSNKASSKSSKRSVKLRELQTKALEARQALEKKQLEERLALEREMLEDSDSEVDSVTSHKNINEWLNISDNPGKITGNSMDETPLPVYDELLRKPVVSASQSCLPGAPIAPSSVQQHTGYHVSQQFRRSYAPKVRYADNIRPSTKISGFLPDFQPLLGDDSSMPIPTVASQQPRMTAYPATSFQHQVAQNRHPGLNPQNVDQPVMSTSTPRHHLSTSQQQCQPHMYSSSAPLDSGHLAARQTVKDLPKFGGDPEDWPRFIAAYERTSRMCAFRNDELLDRLERSLHDKALNAVKSMLLHPDNVPMIINRLKTLFGNAEFIVETMIRRIRMMAPPKADKLETIVDFGVAVQNLCATIQVCQMDERLYNVALLQELVDNLPSTLKMQWALHRRNIGTATMLDFNNWLGEMVEAFSQVIRPTVWHKPQSSDFKFERNTRKEHINVHVHATDPPENVDAIVCLACDNDCSTLDVCTSFLEMSPNARWTLVKEKQICRKCLAKHLGNCDRNIPCNQNGCSYLHHRLLHDERHHKRQPSNTPVQRTSCNVHYSSQKDVLLKYIPVTVFGKGKAIKTYAFLDSGSTSTIIEHSLWRELDLDGKKSPLRISWTDGQKRCEANSMVFSAKIASSQNPGQSFILPEIHTVKTLDLPAQSISAAKLAEHFSHLSDLPIVSYSDVKPRILLGVDSSRLESPFDFREGDENEPMAMLTRLGWVVYGPCSMPEQAKVIEDVASNELNGAQRIAKPENIKKIPMTTDENNVLPHVNVVGKQRLVQIDNSALLSPSETMVTKRLENRNNRSGIQQMPFGHTILGRAMSSGTPDRKCCAPYNSPATQMYIMDYQEQQTQCDYTDMKLEVDSDATESTQGLTSCVLGGSVTQCANAPSSSTSPHNSPPLLMKWN